jgi:hypothetical protein
MASAAGVKNAECGSTGERACSAPSRAVQDQVFGTRGKPVVRDSSGKHGMDEIEAVV